MMAVPNGGANARLHASALARVVHGVVGSRGAPGWLCGETESNVCLWARECGGPPVVLSCPVHIHGHGHGHGHVTEKSVFPPFIIGTTFHNQETKSGRCCTTAPLRLYLDVAPLSRVTLHSCSPPSRRRRVIARADPQRRSRVDLERPRSATRGCAPRGSELRRLAKEGRNRDLENDELIQV